MSVGWMGRLHTRAYRAVREHYPELPVDVRLVAAADPDDGVRAHARDVLGYARTSPAYRDVIEDPEVDVVSICAPNALHREVALAAAEAGKPFWIEKPMGRSAAESRDIARAAADAGLVTAVGFNYRHAPAVARARETRPRRRDRAGDERARAAPRGLLRGSARRAHLALPARPGRIGVLGDLLSHGADLAQLVAGRISSVTGLTETVIRERPLPTSAAAGHFSTGSADQPRGRVENEDIAAVMGRFASGAVVTLEASRVAVGPRAEYALEVHGTTGSLRWDFARLNELQLADDPSGYRTVMAGPGFGDFARFQPGAGTGMGFDDLKTIEAQLFLRSVLEGRQLAPSAADAWAAAEIVDAVERSDASGSWEAVAEVEGTTTYDA
ncbi:Gfo/Idh/MocA family protein [Clavibacter tessellarius]|uniref:Gfo/Idh/MocA family protein n=1 Tax=Clavibacter tessellarius TaxID=31965 RepID=UPI00325463DF